MERSHYERERRDREDEREKLYRRRGDPRGSIDELPYGDERGGGSRRRKADSDGESAGSRRDSKVSLSLLKMLTMASRHTMLTTV